MLRKYLNKKATPAIGVYNAISALLTEKMGFEILYVSGSSLSGSKALPDLGIITLHEVLNLVSEIRAVTNLPLIVDVDTGFGEAINLYRTVKELERIGANAIQIEDQEMPKKCGHLEDKILVSKEEMVKKIKMALEARKSKDFLIIARTDARAVEGLKGVIERSKAYLEAGADIIFPEALESYEEFKIVANEVKAPLMANMTEFGKTPYLTLKEFEEAGYDIVLFPVTLLRASLYAMKEVLKEIKEKKTQRDYLERMMSRKEFYELIDYQKYIELDKRIAKSI